MLFFCTQKHTHFFMDTSGRPKKQIVWLDAIRLLSFLFLLMCHAADPFNAAATYGNGSMTSEAGIMWGQLWGTLVRPCVPLFAMLTGALSFPVKWSMGQFYRRRILRVLWPFLLWSVLYNLFPWVTGVLGIDSGVIYKCFAWAETDSQSLSTCLAAIMRIPYRCNLIACHMWYIYMLIGLYLYLPILSAWVERATRRQLEFVLILWGISTLLPYMKEYVCIYPFGTNAYNAFGTFYYFSGFTGYLLLGHYLRYHFNLSLSKTIPLSATLLVAGYAVTYFGFHHVMQLPDKSPELIELFWTYNSLNVAAMASAWFLLLKHVRISSESRAAHMLATLTSCGFGIYMVHYFFVGLGHYIVTSLSIPIALQIPVSALFIFMFTLILIFLIRKIFRRYSVFVLG